MPRGWDRPGEESVASVRWSEQDSTRLLPVVPNFRPRPHFYRAVRQVFSRGSPSGEQEPRLGLKETWGLCAQCEGTGTPQTRWGRGGAETKGKDRTHGLIPRVGVGGGINVQQTRRRRRGRWETRFVA